MGWIAADPPADGLVLLLRLLTLQEGPSLGDDRPRHTMACAGRLACWQCCHRSGAAGRTSSIHARSSRQNHCDEALVAVRLRPTGQKAADVLGALVAVPFGRPFQSGIALQA